MGQRAVYAGGDDGIERVALAAAQVHEMVELRAGALFRHAGVNFAQQVVERLTGDGQRLADAVELALVLHGTHFKHGFRQRRQMNAGQRLFHGAQAADGYDIFLDG